MEGSFERLWETISKLKGCPSRETAEFIFEQGRRYERKQGSLPLPKPGGSERRTRVVQ